MWAVSNTVIRQRRRCRFSGNSLVNIPPILCPTGKSGATRGESATRRAAKLIALKLQSIWRGAIQFLATTFCEGEPMTDLHRREFLAVAATATAAIVGTKRADAGDPSFMNNVPDPLLAKKELPTFKFALEKSQGRGSGETYAKEATVTQLPISKGIAGVTMGLAPGVMRELHWHATAAEWAYVNKGRVRTTVTAPGGYEETNDFEPGDVWYFPRGHAHVLECLGDKPCHFILMFDNGYFSEFGTLSITDWVGHTPTALLAKNFGLPEATFA